MTKRPDYEYMLVQTNGLEEIVFSSDRLQEVANFCKMNYDTIKRNKSLNRTFEFEGKTVKIIAIDLDADYGE